MDTPRLLIIDDEKDVGEVLVEIGLILGYNAHHVSEITEFKEHLLDWKPAVVITDLQMPQLDGIAVLRMLAEFNPAAKVIIISGMEENLIRISAKIGRERGLSIVATFAKPFNVAEVSAVLQRLKPNPSFTPAAMRDAVLHGQLDVFFQPKHNIVSGELIGAEALVRWIHPVYGAIPPATFMPVADQLGLSGPLLEYVLRQTACHMKDWRATERGMTMAVNMSALNVADMTLPDTLETICLAAGVPCESIILELTENDSMDMSADTMDVLARLRLKGFQLAIDDFGTGFSSLQRLRELPFTELKIDRTFIMSICGDNNSAVIVKSIIALAANLGLRCVAEGIESAEILQLLSEWKCAYGQGYHLGRPMPADQFRDYIHHTSKGTGKAPSAHRKHRILPAVSA
jgi:EAL domain-containing protein (putative c-di-GMP-specific phosphodiesterase class I)/ActR/RegA family two-component response regulator